MRSALAHPDYLRLRVTGIDPQLILPSLPAVSAGEALKVKLRVRVSAGDE